MQLVADLDGRYVEMHVVTDTGDAVAIECEGFDFHSSAAHRKI
jgi:hypothetical protein